MQFPLCVEGYNASWLASRAGAASLAAGISAYLAAANASVPLVELANVTDGCAPVAGRRRLVAAADVAAVTLRALATSRAANSAVTIAVRALNAPATAAACVQLAARLQAAGLSRASGVYLAPVAAAAPSNSSLAVIAAEVAATVGVPSPPSPPPRPPWPPAAAAPPGAMGGAGGAKNRHAVLDVVAASSPGAAIGYALAGVAVLWLPVHMIFHAATAGHVRRTNVTFAVALQCEASLAHGASDLHRSMFARKGRLSQADSSGSTHGGGDADDEAEAAETFVLRGRRFAAPGLAAAAAAFFGEAARNKGPTTVRPLLRSPLLAALGGAGHKGQDASTLAMRRKPKGAWKRLKRALHAELAWHKRAWHHAVRRIKRCLTPRFSAEARTAGASAGHAFRLVPAGEWLGEAAPPTAALFEVCVDFGWRGRVAAAAFRDRLRDADHLRALEDGFAACVAAAEALQGLHNDWDATHAAKQPQQPVLGVRNAGTALLGLLDDEPFARLDAHLTRRELAGARAAPAAYATLPLKSNELGLSPPVAERLATMLLLSLKRKDATARRSSWFGRRSQAETPQSPAAAGGAATRGHVLITSLTSLPPPRAASPVQQQLETVAADVDAWQLSPRAAQVETVVARADAVADAADADSEAVADAELSEASDEASDSLAAADVCFGVVAPAEVAAAEQADDWPAADVTAPQNEGSGADANVADSADQKAQQQPPPDEAEDGGGGDTLTQI